MTCMEDHFLVEDIDFELLDEALYELDHKGVEKVWLSYNPDKMNLNYTKNFYKWYQNPKTPNCLMPSSLQQSIWTKDLFLKLLRPNLNAWQFEVENKHDALDANIIHPRYKALYNELDACRSGKFSEKFTTANLDKEDYDVFSNAREEFK